MRNLQSYNETDALNELRANESLWPSGGMDEDRFFSAVNDEDFVPDKETKLLIRRQKRKIKNREQMA